jgi:hypothetical protein
MDLLVHALVGSSTGSSGRCKIDPGRIVHDLKLNFEYFVEDIKTHHLQKEFCWVDL